MIAELERDAGPTAGAETIDMQEGSPDGILLLHGFGDTPQTLRLLANHLHSSGYDVLAPLLPGHGTNVEAFLQSRMGDWLECARDAHARMRASHSTVSIGGLSMGGALAAIVASENPDVKSLTLLAPYLEMPFTARTAAASHWLWGRAAGARKSSNPRSILDPAERGMNLGYGVYSGRLLFELWRLAAKARQSLAGITVPTLLIQSRADSRIAPEVAERAIRKVAAREKRLVWAEGGGHIITVDYGRDLVFEEVEAWVTGHLTTG